MDPLTDRLLRLLQAHHGWRRCLLLIQDTGGRVGWVKLPDDLDLALRLNTDDTVGVTWASNPDRADGDRGGVFDNVDRLGDRAGGTIASGEQWPAKPLASRGPSRR
jgi:hypothetical protein